jgi:hypothetical protein
VTPTPTPDETASWKTYTNDKFGYSFSYPGALTLVENDLGFVTLGRLISINVGKSSFNLDCYNYQISTDPNILPLEHCPSKGLDKNTYKDIQVNGQPSLKITGIMRGIPMSFISVIIKHNALFYELSVNEIEVGPDPSILRDRTPQPVPKKEIELFNQILSTFRFD